MARIEDYAIIGDGESAALVSRHGSIDWLCWPRFDSPACFAALLGTREHGYWSIAPVEKPERCSRRYRDETLVLETTFECAGGRVLLIDFMPANDDAADLARLVMCLEGRVAMRTEFRSRFDYGSIVPWISQSRNGATELHAVAGPDRLTLRTPIELKLEQDQVLGEFTLAAGEEMGFVLTHSASHLPVPPPIDIQTELRKTESYWKAWSSKCAYQGPWREAVVRSLITLKSLIYEPTGGIVAAATTSLPEHIGGTRNWDYRICWLRDATFTLLTLMNAGYAEEAAQWRDWLVRALAGAPAQAQIMYGLGGERRLTEWEVTWLPGYENSRPVRIGNAAAKQQQLDIYGEVADALHHARLGGLAPAASAWAVQTALTDHVCSTWQEPDEGIWEVRGPRQHFTHSKVMAWVALDRAIKSARKFNFEAPFARWRELRARIHADVLERGYSTKRGSFVQAYGSESLDASLLLIPLVGFLPPEDARVRGTVEAIGRELGRDGLILRYHTTETDDGLPPGEGAFLPCSFWYADNLALQGRQDEALALFERLLGFRNDVGLLAEEYDPRAQRQLGNYPQAFTHVALVSTAYNLTAHEPAKPSEQRGAAG
jgi:GH15 family glucan-1,4-alpha-glucosidase